MNVFELFEAKKKSLKNPSDNPCWTDYHPVGTKQKSGRTVPNCVPNEGVEEAANAAQQAAIAIAKKKKSGVAERQVNEVVSVAGLNTYQEMPSYKNYKIFVSKRPYNQAGNFLAYSEIGRTEIKAAGKNAQDAVRAIQEKIDQMLNATKVEGSATLDFNVKFATDILGNPRQPFFAKIISVGGEPKLVMAGNDMLNFGKELTQLGFKPSALRIDPESERAHALPSISYTKNQISGTGLIANGRYELGNAHEDQDGNTMYDLVYHSTAHTKSDKIRLNKPAFTVGTVRTTSESMAETKHKPEWTIEQHTNGHHNAFYIVRGYDRPREVWKDSRGRSDFRNRAAAEAKAAELNQSGVAEANFNPSRRGFLKKAGAAAVATAMPRGLAGAAMKAVAPAVTGVLADKELHNLAVSSLGGMSGKDLARAVLKGGGGEVSANQAAYMKKLADEWGLDLTDPTDQEEFELSMSDRVHDDYLERVADASGSRMAGSDYGIDDDYFDKDGKWRGNVSWDADDEGGDSSDNYVPGSTNAAGLARSSTNAAGLARKFGDWVNGDDTGPMDQLPTKTNAALPAPTTNPGMQIPKQKSKAYAQQKDDEELAENWGEPLTGWHVVYARTGNKVSGTPDFDSRDSAHKYLLTKMSANHHNYRVSHADQLGTSAPTPMGGYLESKGMAEGTGKEYHVINHRGTPTVVSPSGKMNKNFSSTYDAQQFAKKKNAEIGKKKGVAEAGHAGADDTDTVGFYLDTERAYQAVMGRYGDMIDHDETSGIMYVPARLWPKIEMIAFDADGIGALRDDDLENPEHYGIAEAAVMESRLQEMRAAGYDIL